MNVHPLKQKDSSACGPTCMKMAIDAFGLPYTLKHIEKVSEYKKKHGLSNKDLIEVLRQLGMHVQPKAHATWADLKRYSNAKNVIIVSWMMKGYIGHFSVVQKVDKKNIYLADPFKGKIIKMDKVIFHRLWMDYDDMWFPKKNTDIQLRWMAVVTVD